MVSQQTKFPTLAASTTECTRLRTQVQPTEVLYHRGPEPRGHGGRSAAGGSPWPRGQPILRDGPA